MILYIAAEFFAEACGPAFEPYAVIGLELCFGTKPMNDVAGMIAQSGGQADDYGHQRAEHDILIAVAMLMLQQMAGGIFVGYYKPAEAETAPIFAHFKAQAVSETQRLFARNE